MRQTCRGPALLLLGGLGLGLAPNQARGSCAAIQFIAHNDSPRVVCVAADGPWGRTSDAFSVQPHSVTPGTLFFEANDTLFSPFGLWTIDAFPPDERGICAKGVRSASAQDCMVRDNGQVHLYINWTGNGDPLFAGVVNDPNSSDCSPHLAAGATAAAATPGAATAVAAAFLGHDELAPGANQPAQRVVGRGSDHFQFAGRAGDTVELTLDRDGARGSTGEVARLSLAGGGGVLGKRQGALPLELKATLPTAGRYRVEVAEVDGGSGGEPFRGHYRLRVSSATSRAILLEPLRSVEP